MLWLVLIIVAGLVGAVCLCSASAPPKEECPKCGGDVYPVELNESIYRECTKCGWHHEDTF